MNRVMLALAPVLSASMASRALTAVVGLTALAALTAPTAAAAQQAVRVPPVGAGWLGVTYDVRWVVEGGDGCASRVIVDGVAQGSPAQRAGIRGGDVLIAINGDRTPAARLRVLPGVLASGDSVRLVVARDGATREVTAIADRRPDRPPATAPGVGASSVVAPPLAPGRRLAPSATQALAASRDLPVVYLDGDRITASNVETGGGQAGAVGYWLVAGQEQPVYRSLPARPRNELDVRVAGLLRCAAEQSRSLPALVALDLGHVRERAESLRVVIARRAQEYRDREGQEAMLRELVAARTSELDGALSHLFTQLGAPRLPAGATDVFGAETVTMEPELAAYFQGARGLLVVRVAPGSPARRSGLRPGDVIMAAAGRPVASQADLRAVVAGPEAGSTRAVELSIVRQGRRQTVSLPRP